MTNSAIIRRCASIPEALVCVGLLKSRGLLAEIDNAAHAELDWGSIPAFGGVAIRVPRSQFDIAKQVIIDAIEAADATLADTFDPGADWQVDTGRRRWRAWTMLFIFLGGAHLVFGYLLAQVFSRLPKSWFPEPPAPEIYFGIPVQSQIAPPELAWDGIIFLLVIGLFLIWEFRVLTRESITKDD